MNNKPKKKETLSLSHHVNYGKVLYMFFAIVIMMTLLSVTCFAAETTDMWTKTSEIMQDVYGKVIGISTIAAVVTAVVALLLMNF